MKANSATLQFPLRTNITKATNFAIEQLNLLDGRGDFEIYEETVNEVVLRNNTACSTFCTKKESCDVRFCNQRRNQIQRGITFIDSGIDMALLSCANLGDGYCEVRITISS